MASLLERIVTGANTIIMQKGIEIVASRWGAQDITFDQFRTELATLAKISFSYNSGYYPETPSTRFPKTAHEAAEYDLSPEEVRMMFVRNDIVVPAFDINGSGGRTWVNLSEYKPEAYRVDSFVVKRREKTKHNTVFLEISFEISVEDLPVLGENRRYSRTCRFAHFEILGYKIPPTASHGLTFLEKMKR